jgi:anti-sigma factor RsiW
MEHNDAIRSGAVARYLLDEMSDADREDYEVHFLSCPRCARDVTIGSEFVESLRAFFGSLQCASRDRNDCWVKFV